MDVTLNGETRLYYIVGDPIAQVKSPPALTGILVERGANALVVPAHVAPADLDGFIAAARATRNVDGIVVTVPHKIAALGHCDETTERARFAGSTNVMRRGGTAAGAATTPTAGVISTASPPAASRSRARPRSWSAPAAPAPPSPTRSSPAAPRT